MGIWTVPKLVYETGTIASFVILFISAIFSFVVASFINEIQGNGNAIRKLGLSQERIKCVPMAVRRFFTSVRLQFNALLILLKDCESKTLDEDKHNLLGDDECRSIEDNSVYAVTERIELSMAVKTILGERSVKVFYLFILCSLQIALSAYMVTIAKTSRNLLCRQMSCESSNFTESSDDQDDFISCGELNITERAVYILGKGSFDS